MALSQHPYRRIAKKAQMPFQTVPAPWSPPPLTELVARIDAALAARRPA